MPRLHLLSALAAVVILVTPAPAQSIPKVTGYLQARETYQPNIGLTASLNRVRVSVEGALSQFSYRVQAEYEVPGTGTAAATVSLRDAYIRWHTDPINITVGQFKTPFSREFITSITTIETADRATVVDSLAPKRDIGMMGDVTVGTFGTVSLGVFNGDGQNKPTNRDSTLLEMARLTVRPVSFLTLGGEIARYNSDSVRRGMEASADYAGFTLRGEYIIQHRGKIAKDDDGWFGLAAFRVVPWIQLVAKREEFERPGIKTASKMSGTTAGANIDLPGGKARLILNYVRRRLGDPGIITKQLISQLQVRF